VLAGERAEGNNPGTNNLVSYNDCSAQDLTVVHSLVPCCCAQVNPWSRNTEHKFKVDPAHVCS